MNEQLFLSILAMDAYNRKIDPTTNVGLDVVGSSIGSAFISTAPENRAAGFFAQSYSWNGKTIIAYRGADEYATDIPQWVMGGGIYDTAQTRLAAQFYQTITGAAAPDANVILTGHSLGAGLAGLVGDIYGVPSRATGGRVGFTDPSRVEPKAASPSLRGR